ncbi:MAG: asparagine synthase (glutamine-hydrolyzing) [Chloroflexi bacterium]|nr:asparagine synthase (glutamine-hydrolyzing) [Chloroflexota bacterium]
MCGITGFVEFSHSQRADDLRQRLESMMDAIRHRGPDDSGSWLDPAAGVALGFRRLAILDLSPAGRQPMVSADGNYVIVFNGEIYNHAGLRQELLSHHHVFIGTSDTEVMLAAIVEWGLEAAVKRFNGMFAFALWHIPSRRLFLVRDRMGIKPLYYGQAGDVFLFGSELKALKAHPAFEPEIDRDALAAYLRTNYIPAPYSIYKGIRKLWPGSILTLAADGIPSPPGIISYWSTGAVAEMGKAGLFREDDQDLVEQFDGLLRDSLKDRMVADVPLGAFLSGGIDSSTVVALMQAQSRTPVKTFTIGFQESQYDEAGYAREIARRLGTEHHELYVTPAEALAVIPNLPALYDEPFADSSQIPTFLVSQMTRRHVTVSLSGDGGDELFGGYNRYQRARQIWSTFGWLPQAARRFLGDGMAALASTRAGGGSSTLPPTMLPMLDKASRLGTIVSAGTVQELYIRLFSFWPQPGQVAPGGQDRLSLFQRREAWPHLSHPLDWMMYLDQVTYLPDNNLVKVDRASMGVSLEARVPFLDDHRVVEFAWRLPNRMKIRGGKRKWILRQVLSRYVPPALFERPKMGFAAPIADWLRGPLREWSEDLIQVSRLRQEGFLDARLVRQKWDEHLSGKLDRQFQIWPILMFEAWLNGR